jgi:uncharacterized repeat protein (TIGR03803 family)
VLVQAADGDFYGTTQAGGTKRDGTAFKIDANGTFTSLHSFCSESRCSDGSKPYSGMIQATDGNLYGTAFSEGANFNSLGGTIYKIAPSGAFTTVYSFCAQGFPNCTDGFGPEAPLVQDTNGDFYSTTFGGGANDDGTVFRLSVGLGPFVETQPTIGNAGMMVKILGTNLSGATSVSFNGAAAVFEVRSASEIVTTVPVGATSGTVEVVTPHGLLSSNVAFRVM